MQPGIDVSAANICKAQQKAKGSGYAERLALVAGDYVCQPLERYDGIVSASTLHLIDCPTAQLLDKIARDLEPGGLLIFTMPEASLFNRVLWLVRRLFRMVRGSATDRLALAVARALHNNLSEPLLRERVSYMYLLPYRYFASGFKRDLRSRGLEPLTEAAVPHVSIGQPRHRLGVYQKRTEP